MKKLSFLLSAGLFLFLGTFAHATDLQEMSATERAAFGAEVRAYLLANPEVILEVIDVLDTRKAERTAITDLALVQQNYDALAHDGYSFVGGNPDGAITIVEFSDYKCGYCKRAHVEVQALLAANDDIRLVIKEFPILGDESMLAAQAAVSILTKQPEYYAEFNDLLMLHNGAPNSINPVTLAEIATNIGADAILMRDHMNDPLVQQIIARNHALGRDMQIRGTPAFVIGSALLRGYMPLAGMQNMVDNARTELE